MCLWISTWGLWSTSRTSVLGLVEFNPITSRKKMVRFHSLKQKLKVIVFLKTKLLLATVCPTISECLNSAPTKTIAKWEILHGSLDTKISLVRFSPLKTSPKACLASQFRWASIAQSLMLKLQLVSTDYMKVNGKSISKKRPTLMLRKELNTMCKTYGKWTLSLARHHRNLLQGTKRNSRKAFRG